jgi:parallel beta-helix repeat protein
MNGQALPFRAVTGVPDVFNVKDYGATGDGTTTDTTAVQSCVDAALGAGGGIVYFPAGTYVIAMITFGSNVTVVGAGKGNTVLLMDPAVYTATGLYGNPSTAVVGRIAPASSSASTSYFRMRDLTIDGNKATWGANTSNRMMGFYCGQGTSGLVTHGSFANVEIRNCMTYAFDIENCQYVTLTDCEAHDNGYISGSGTHINADGFTLIGDDLTSIGCLSYNNANSGFSCGQAGVTWHRIELDGCEGFNNGDYGASLGSSSGYYLYGARVVGGRYYSNARAGVYLTIGCQFGAVVGAHAYNNGTNGILVSGGSYNTVQGNTCQNNAVSASSQPEIYLTNSSTYNTVMGNAISSANATHAITERDSSTDYNIMSGNIAGSTSTAIVPAGPNSVAKNNQGYNPRGVLGPPTVPGSGTPYTNGYFTDCTVVVTGGTVTGISVGGTSTGLTSGTFRVPAGQTITLTYSAAPSWMWVGD